MPNNSSSSSQNSGKTSILRGIFSTKEPSAHALDQYEKQIRKQQKSRDKKGTVRNGMSMSSSAKLPKYVPKVNSKWDGLPSTTSSLNQTSNSWSDLAFSSRSMSSGSSAFSRDKDLQPFMERNTASSVSSGKSINDAGSEDVSVSGESAGMVSGRTLAKHSHIPGMRKQTDTAASTRRDSVTNCSESPIADNWLEDDLRQVDFQLEEVFAGMCAGYNQRRNDRTKHNES